MKEPLLICLMGAECSGKTTLAQALARHFAGRWVPEHLRRFCEVHGRTPKAHEQAGILQAQLALEAQTLVLARNEGCGYVFCDTAPLLTAIYSDFHFSDSTLYERARALQERYALTLALAPDLPWRADGGQRDGAPTRARIHALIERELARQPRVARISGTGEARLQAAIRAVQSLASDPICKGPP